jgi:DNA-binding HxlR family transcriptional regulator
MGRHPIPTPVGSTTIPISRPVIGIFFSNSGDPVASTRPVHNPDRMFVSFVVALGMAGYGQFCAVARAHEVFGARWTLLIVRELLSGARRFNEIRQGIPRISRTMPSERLHSLVALAVVQRTEGLSGPEYAVTEAGAELADQIRALGVWGQRWLPRRTEAEDFDLEPLLLDMRRRVKLQTLPRDPMVVRFEVRGYKPRFLLLKSPEISLCDHNLGFPEPLVVRAKREALAAWWRGDIDFLAARRMGLELEGPRKLIRAFPSWFDRYLFAEVGPARRSVSTAA